MQSEMSIRNHDGQQSPGPFPAQDAVHHAVQNFEAISLEAMDSVKLMNRFDKKFVFSTLQLPEVLNEASRCYKVLQIGDQRVFDYASLYFDTVGYRMYSDHHNQKQNRFKVRKREYLNSQQVFLEIKYKTNKGQTRKKRIETENRNKDFVKEEKRFIKSITPYRGKMLYPALHNRFSRITLVHKKQSERVTIDMNLDYRFAGKNKGLPLLTIAEIKQDRSSGISDIERIFKNHRILPMNFSKYCMGMVLLNPKVKYNRFKEKYLKIKKLSNDGSYAQFDH